MDLTSLASVSTPSDMITWLEDNCITPIRPVMSGSDISAILQKAINVLGTSIPAMTENSTSAALVKTDLNTAYPDAVAGFCVLCANINAKYLKLDNSPTGNWDMQPYNPVV